MGRLRILIAALTTAAAVIAGAGTADAAAGHTSCRDLGATTAEEAKAHTVAPEVLEFAPGGVDDLIALVQLGGTFGGETVPPLCQPK
jgi:hypothetical protein